MADVNIKQVNLGSDFYEINAKYIQDTTGAAKSWADIEALAQAQKLKILVSDTVPEAKAANMGILWLVPESGAVSGTYAEYIVYENPTGTFKTEKIGTTQADLSQYVKKGTQADAALSDGAHTHTVTGKVSVPVYDGTKTGIKATATQGAVTAPKANAVISISETKAGDALGTAATFATTVTPTTTNIGATASGTAIGVASSGSAITGVEVSATKKVLGENSTFAVTGGALTGATPASKTPDSWKANVPTTPAVIDTTKFSGGSITGGSVTGGVYSGATPAKFTQGTDTFTQGSQAEWNASVNDSGVLSFSFTKNTLPTFNQGTDSFTPNAVGTVSAISYTAPELTPAAFQSGFYTAGTKGSAAEFTEGTFTPNVVGSVSAIGVTANKVDVIDAATAVASTGSDTFAKTVEVTAQPTIALASGATGTGVVLVATGITSAATTVNASDAVEVNSYSVEASDKAEFVQSVTVADPTVTLATDASAALKVVTEVTSTAAKNDIENGLAAENGAHTHDVTLA